MHVKRGKGPGRSRSEQPRSRPAERRSQAQRSEATRRALIATARELFAARGYAGVGTEEIVRASGVTRGALYHHFGSKVELFAAVFEQIERELAERLAREALSKPDPLEALIAGAEMFLDVCLEPEVQRIALLDAPSVLNWERWREIEARHGLGLIVAGLEAAMEGGVLQRQPVEPLAHVLLGALIEAGLYVARAEDVADARAEAGHVLRGLLAALEPSR